MPYCLIYLWLFYLSAHIAYRNYKFLSLRFSFIEPSDNGIAKLINPIFITQLCPHRIMVLQRTGNPCLSGPPGSIPGVGV